MGGLCSQSRLAPSLCFVRPSHSFSEANFRIIVRGIVEFAMHMEAACTKPEYLRILLDDDKASRRSRGKAFQKSPSTLTEASNRRLQQFVVGDGAKPA